MFTRVVLGSGLTCRYTKDICVFYYPDMAVVYWWGTAEDYVKGSLLPELWCTTSLCGALVIGGVPVENEGAVYLAVTPRLSQHAKAIITQVCALPWDSYEFRRHGPIFDALANLCVYVRGVDKKTGDLKAGLRKPIRFQGPEPGPGVDRLVQDVTAILVQYQPAGGWN